jgi:hypothetical protein
LLIELFEREKKNFAHLLRIRETKPLLNGAVYGAEAKKKINPTDEAEPYQTRS